MEVKFMSNEDYTVKVGNKGRKTYASGFSRQDDSDKIDYTTIPVQFIDRFANHMTKGMRIHGRDNWRSIGSDEQLQRCISSAFRHFMSWYKGQQDQDHLCACAFNMIAYDVMKVKLIEMQEQFNESILS